MRIWSRQKRLIIKRSESVSSLTSERVQIAPWRLTVRGAQVRSTEDAARTCATKEYICSVSQKRGIFCLYIKRISTDRLNNKCEKCVQLTDTNISFRFADKSRESRWNILENAKAFCATHHRLLRTRQNVIRPRAWTSFVQVSTNFELLLFHNLALPILGFLHNSIEI